MSKHLSETDTDSQGMTHLHAGASYFVRREGENMLGCKGNEFFDGGINLSIIIIHSVLQFFYFPSRKNHALHC